jgi:hypothetical protein
MIARLLDSVQALAGVRDAGIEPAELAAEYADSFLLVSDCRQLHLSPHQLNALQSLDDMLADRDPSTIGDADVRAAAQRALAALETA